MADNEKGNKVRSRDIGTSSSRVNEAPDTSCVTLVQHLINQNRLLIEILQQHHTPILNLSQIQPQVQLEAVQALTPQVSMPPASRRTHGDVPHVDSKDASIICFMCDEQGHYARECPQQKRKTLMRTEDEVRKMIITSTEWPPPGMTKRQRRNTFRGAPQLTEHLLANGGRVSDSEDSDQVSSDDEEEKSPQGFNQNKMEHKACSRCGEIGHVASSCATTCVHCEEDHPPDRCPTSRITCFFCEGTDHVPKDCQFSFLLTKKMANQPASSNGEKHQGNTNPRQDYSFSLTPVPGQRNQNEKRKCRVREDICCFNCQGMGHFADKCPKPRNIAASTSVHATPCNQKLAPQRIVIHASRSSPIARVATAPAPASALPQGVNAQLQPQPSVDKTEASIGIVPLDVPAQQPRNQVQDEEPERTNHVPKDCQLSVLLTKTAEIQRTTLRLSPQLVSSNSHIDDIIHSTNAPPAAPDPAINHSDNTFSTNHSLHRQSQQRIVVDGRSCVFPRPTPGRAKGNQPPEGDTKQKTVIRLKQQSEGSFSYE
uniref:Zinc knuckle containing protein-like n=1 Tax=Oryza nivara TaxID=4536 RepID=A0A679BEA0_ORYNI|nr:zinc knuckle containing protein-like [Oryza sativa f. spontanea]